MNAEHDDDYQEEQQEEREEFGSRSIFAAGWFRAVLVLTVLAIVVVVSLPYLLNWFEPAPPPRVAKPSEPTASAPAEQPSGSAPVAPEHKPAIPAVVARPSQPATAPAPQPKRAPEVTPAPTARRANERPAPRTPDHPPVIARASKPEPAVRATGASEGADRYWVQLGAFREAANAEALARTVRSEGFSVQVSEVTRTNATAQGAAQRHELFVTKAPVDKVSLALKGRGRAQTAPGGVVVKPAFSLDEAMSVSRQLTADGFNVVIRPAGGIGDGTVHVVRAGGYPDRAGAIAARNALKAKGIDGFVAEGSAR